MKQFIVVLSIIVLVIGGLVLWADYHHKQVVTHQASGVVIYDELPSGYYHVVSLKPAKVRQTGDGRTYLIKDGLPADLQQEGKFFTVAWNY